MSVLPLVFTRVGMERFTAAQLGEDIDLTIAAVGFTDQAFVAAPTLTAVPGELRRVTAVSGEAVGDNIVHLTVRDDGAVAYTVRGFGLFLADGTLFAASAQADPIVGKSALTSLYFAFDIAFPAGDIDQIVFGDTSFLNPPATTVTKGVVELATLAEGQAGTDPQRVPPVSVVAALIGAVSTTLQGAMTALQNTIFGRRVDTSGLLIGGGDLSANRLLTVPAASAAEVLAATSDAKAVTPAALGGALASRTITGAGLVTGGGSIDQNRVLTVPAASAAEVLAATNAGKAVTPAALGALAHSYQPTGYTTLPGGLILQWGQYRASTTLETTATAPFPIAFPTACLMRSATGYIAGASTSKDLWVQLVGAAALDSITVQYQQATGDRAIDGFDWFAIGY